MLRSLQTAELSTPVQADIKSQLGAHDTFLCKALTTVLSVENCLGNYVEANALGLRNSVCHRCPQGAEVRASFANS